MPTREAPVALVLGGVAGLALDACSVSGRGLLQSLGQLNSVCAQTASRRISLAWLKVCTGPGAGKTSRQRGFVVHVSRDWDGCLPAKQTGRAHQAKVALTRSGTPWHFHVPWKGSSKVEEGQVCRRGRVVTRSVSKKISNVAL